MMTMRPSPCDPAMLDLSDRDVFQPPQIYAEGTWLYGAIVSCILYGITIVLYVMCFHSLWCRIRSRDHTQKKQWFFFIYVNVVFALNTLYIAANMQVTNLSLINDRNYPGGPNAYELHTSPAPLTIPFIMTNWCSDFLMIWRCHVVYRDSKYYLFVTIFGCLMLAASVITGSLWAIIVSQTGGPSPDATWMSFNLLFPYLSVSLSINVLVCILTVLRLMYHRACISKAFGPKYGVVYTSIASIIVESAAVYAICSLLYLIPYAVGSPLANAFCQILGVAQVIAPLLIILRVSEGKAWERDASRRLAASHSFLLRGLATAAAEQTSGTLPVLNNLDVRLEVALQGPPTTNIQCEGSIPPARANEETLKSMGVESGASRFPLSLDRGSVQRSHNSVWS